jgi:CRISPR system Cascade subunit CasE
VTHLSVLDLNIRHAGVRRDLADCQDLHKTLMKALGQVEGEAARRHFGLLYRVDQTPRGARVAVQSASEPDWDQLPTGYLQRAQSKAIDGMLHSLETGQRLRFRLLANPTRRATGFRVGAEGRPETEFKGKRVPLKGDDELRQWIARQGARCGFEIPPVAGAAVVPDVSISNTGISFGRKGNARITVASALFDGHLRITDRGSFLEAVRVGVGPGKAYGHGLLSLGPPA